MDDAVSEILRLCLAFEQSVRTSVSTLRCTPGDRRQVASSVLILRLLEFHETALGLMQAGKVTAARVLVRAAIEVAFTSRAIIASDELFDKWPAQQARKKATMIRKGRGPEMAALSDLHAAANEAPLEEIAAEAREVQPLKVEDLARAAGMYRTYVTAYALLSESVHSSAGEMIKHVELAEDGSLKALRAAETVDDIPILAGAVSEMLWRTLGAVGLAYGVETPSDPKERMLEIRRAVDGMAH